MKLNNARNQTNRTRQSAFTLVELLLVLTILAILAGIVLPKMTGRTQQARITRAQTEISTFSTALGAFEVDNGFYPKGRSGLLALVQVLRFMKSSPAVPSKPDFSAGSIIRRKSKRDEGNP